jgi:hypothetical protein
MESTLADHVHTQPGLLGLFEINTPELAKTQAAFSISIMPLGVQRQLAISRSSLV